jgi:hypothetical protein
VLDGDTVRFALHGAAPERAALLQTLLARGLKVSHFAAITEDLQQSYLNSLTREASA